MRWMTDEELDHAINGADFLLSSQETPTGTILAARYQLAILEELKLARAVVKAIKIELEIDGCTMPTVQAYDEAKARAEG